MNTSRVVWLPALDVHMVKAIMLWQVSQLFYSVALLLSVCDIDAMDTNKQAWVLEKDNSPTNISLMKKMTLAQHKEEKYMEIKTACKL